MATGELRERVRERLVSAEHGLDRALAGAPPAGDEVVALLADGHREEVALRRAPARQRARRLRRRHDRHDPRLLPGGARRPRHRRRRRPRRRRSSRTSATCSSEVVDDLYVRRFHGSDEPPFDRAPGAADRAARGRQPDARRSSRATRRTTRVAAMRAPARATRSARSSSARKRALAVMTYDDLLTRLDDDARGPERRRRVAARLRERYHVVLVDEFQDTDPVQWDIMRRAFGDGERDARADRRPEAGDLRVPRRRRLRLPRGRARPAGTRATLDVNWRSDQGLIDAYDALFGGAKLGHEGIVYRQVRAADANQAPRLHGAPSRRAAAHPGRRTATSRVDHDRARLRAGQLGPRARRPRPGGRPRRAAVVGRRGRDPRRGRHDAAARAGPPGHVAVLVRTNRDAALDPRRARARSTSRRSSTAPAASSAPTPAREWLRLLEALERPDLDRARARRGAHRRSSAGRAERVAAGRRRRAGRRSTAACTTGRACCASTASRR